MSRPTNKENLKSLADQLVWAIITYVKGGLDDIKGDGWRATDDTLHDIGIAFSHEDYVFPTDTNLTCTFSTHANANTWSAWTRIVDSGATNLDASFTSEAHICELDVETVSRINQIWMCEIAYGAAKNIVARFRLRCPNLNRTRGIIAIHGEHIPSGEILYYRLKNDAGGDSWTCNIRWHFH